MEIALCLALLITDLYLARLPNGAVSASSRSSNAPPFYGLTEQHRSDATRQTAMTLEN
jgi:hypothetical protein